MCDQDHEREITYEAQRLGMIADFDYECEDLDRDPVTITYHHKEWDRLERVEFDSHRDALEWLAGAEIMHKESQKERDDYEDLPMGWVVSVYSQGDYGYAVFEKHIGMYRTKEEADAAANKLSRWVKQQDMEINVSPCELMQSKGETACV